MSLDFRNNYPLSCVWVLGYFVAFFSENFSEEIKVTNRLDEMPRWSMVTPGDINLGHLSYQFRGSDINLCPGKDLSTGLVYYAMAVQYTLDKINKDPNLLPNLTLGSIVVDTCGNSMNAVGQALKFIPGGGNDSSICKNSPSHENYDVVGIIGPIRSASVFAIGGLLGLYQIPFLSGYATSDDLSDRALYGHFFRVIPPDSMIAKVMVDVMVYFNWTYISVVYEESPYGFNGVIHIKRHTRMKDICIANTHSIPGDATADYYAYTIRRIMKDKNAKILVSFVLGRKLEMLMAAAKEINVENKLIFIATVGTTDNLVPPGSISVDIYIEPDPQFKAYIENMSPITHPNNPWLKKLWERRLGCGVKDLMNRSSSCWETTMKDIPDYIFRESYSRLSLATYFFAQAIHSLIKQMCPQAFHEKKLLKSCVRPALLIENLKQVKLDQSHGQKQFDEFGALIPDFTIFQKPRDWKEGSQLKAVGRWSEEMLDINEEALEWNEEQSENMHSIPESVCAKPCAPGEFLIQGELLCCWDCKRCRDNEYVTENGTNCDQCPFLTWPDPSTYKDCLKITPSYLQWSDSYGISLTCLACLGLLVSFFISFVLIKSRDRKVVKGSSIGFMSIIISGLMMVFTSVLLFIAKPTALLCLVSRVGFNLSCTLIFAPLLVKTNRVYQVFRASSKFTRVGPTAKSSVAAILVFFMIIAQVAIITVCAFLWPIKAKESMPAITVRYVELSCNQEMLGLILPLSYNMFIIFLCCIIAFLTRKLPDNFNESWFILLSVSATLFVWIAFLPTYFNAFYASHKAALLGLSLILNGLITLVCFFATKIYALVYIDEKDIKTTNFETESFDVTPKSVAD